MNPKPPTTDDSKDDESQNDGSQNDESENDESENDGSQNDESENDGSQNDESENDDSDDDSDGFIEGKSVVDSNSDVNSNSESKTDSEVNYPGELAVDINTYIDELSRDITKIKVHLCFFKRDTTHKFVKYILSVENEIAAFPTFEQETMGVSASDDHYGGFDTEKITAIQNAMFSSTMNIEYRGFIPYQKDLFAFFEIEDDEYTLNTNHLKSVINDLNFLKKVNGIPVSETVSAFFDGNSDLRYYDETQVSPPHCGTLITDLNLFGRGKYFEINGNGDDRYAFFVKTIVYLLGDDMIDAFLKRPDEQKIIDYDGIFFRKDGKDHWFIPDTDAVVPI
jgi:hypothetical protein